MELQSQSITDSPSQQHASLYASVEQASIRRRCSSNDEEK
jgi:hypothetical protein